MMRINSRFVIPTLVISFFCLGIATAMAVSDDDVAAAKREADYAEAIKRQKLAEREAAEATAAMVDAQTKARLATEKAELEADKARTDYYKSLLPTAPDPKKYSITPPTAPNLAATATYRNIAAIRDDQNGLAGNISRSIIEAITGDKTCAKTEKSILLEDPKTKPSIGLYKATMVFLSDADRQIRAQTSALNKSLKEPVSDYKFSPLAAPLALFGILSSLGETAVSFATILKTQYAATTTSQTTAADSILAATVLGRLTGHLTVIETDAVIDTPLDPALLSPWDAACSDIPNSPNTLLGATARLTCAMRDARLLLDSAIERIKNDTDAAKKEATKPTFASPFEKPVQRLTTLLDLTNKQLVALYAADPQGGIPFDIAQRGEAITGSLNSTCAYVLSLKVLSSDVDTLAADSLFKGYRLSMATNTVARWKLVRPNGALLATDIANGHSPWSKIQIPD